MKKIFLKMMSYALVLSCFVSFLGGCGKKEVVVPKLPTETTEQPISSQIISSEKISKPEPIATPEFTFTEEEITKLNTMLDEWTTVKEEEEEDGSNVAVFFRDIESGLTYTYNGDQVFLVASLNKAPYAMYLYHLVEIGQASLEETFYVTKKMIEETKENSGKLIEMDDLPKDFTLAEMIELMVCYSDTAALRILLARYGAEGYKEYMEQVGVPTENINNVTNGRITANEAGDYLNALYTFFETSAYGETLKTQMRKTNYFMIRTKNQYVGKYGWDKGSYHDMAIIYADHPYQLAILTDKDMGSWTEFGMFSKIAYRFEEMMNEKWASVGG